MQYSTIWHLVKIDRVQFIETHLNVIKNIKFADSVSDSKYSSVCNKGPLLMLVLSYHLFYSIRLLHRIRVTHILIIKAHSSPVREFVTAVKFISRVFFNYSLPAFASTIVKSNKNSFQCYCKVI